MNNDTLQIVLRAKDLATKTIRNVQRNLNGLARNRSYRAIASGFTSIKDSVGQVGKAVVNMKTVFVSALAGLGIQRFVGASLAEFQKLQNSMIGLSSVANKMGESMMSNMGFMAVDSESATEAAKNLASDGLMTVNEAATSLKNLLLKGFGLNESVDMLNAFKDSAAFGRQGALSFGQAVMAAAEGVKNENSILVDNAGITKNLSIMQKEYAQSIGKTVAQLTEADKRQAIYRGVINEAMAMQGDASRLTETFSGSVAQLNANFLTLQSTIGSTVAPVIKTFIDNTLKPAIEAATDWVGANQDLIQVKVKDWLESVATSVKALTSETGGLNSEWSGWLDTLKGIGTFIDEHPIIAGAIGGFALTRNPVGVLLGAGYGATVQHDRATEEWQAREDARWEAEQRAGLARMGVTVVDNLTVVGDTPQAIKP